jgi:regulator of RNase E activity RraA
MRLEALQEASAAIVADALDRMGLHDQVLSESIRPHWPAARCVGLVYPVVVSADSSTPTRPYDGEMSALDGLQPGDVAVFEVEPGVRAASWGELFSCGALGRGARGAIVDGMVRDATQIEELGFPTFARGCSPLDTFERAVVSSHGDSAVVGGVPVDRGDVIVADRDGIVVIPAAVIDPVIETVATKRVLEQGARDDLLAGMAIRDVWEKYQVF